MMETFQIIIEIFATVGIGIVGYFLNRLIGQIDNLDKILRQLEIDHHVSRKEVSDLERRIYELEKKIK